MPEDPGHEAIPGEPCYPDLAAVRVEVEVDLVNVLRRPGAVPSVVDQATARGVGHPVAVARARASSLEAVSGRCLAVENAARRAALERRR